MSTYSDASLILPVAPEYKAGKIYSLKPTDGTGDFDFSRATTATRINKDGLIETVGSNIPRLNYPMIDGVVSGCPSLLLEPERTNVFRYSEDFDNSFWNKGSLTVTSNQTISLDGLQTADKITPNATTGGIRIGQTKTTSATTYSLSFFVKYNGKQYVQLLFGGLLNSVDFSNFDLINGTVTLGTGEIESFGNGWYKISLTASLNAATDQAYLWSIDSATSSRGASSTGNGSDGYFVWGAQLEAGSYPTSYIPTNGSTVTRVAETCNGAGDANTFNSQEGVLYAEINPISIKDQSGYFGLLGTSASNRIIIGFPANSNNVTFYVISQGTNIAVSSYDIGNMNQYIKVALKYKENDFALWINGVEVLTHNSGTPNVQISHLGFYGYTTNQPFYGKVKDLRVYDTALTDQELIALTS